jgi:cardiolipin synthase
MVALTRYGIAHGIELRINWPGRLAVAPTMGAPFFAMLALHAVALVMLYVGMVLSLSATVLYVRSGLREIRARNGRPKLSS